MHRRQFVCGPAAHLACPDWQTAELGPDLILSHCPELRVARVADATGNPWVLLGLAVQTIAERPDPLAAIESVRTDDVPLAAESWAGRWVLIGGGRLHPDAAGLLGCFHGIAPDGAVWTSSSAALVAPLVTAPGMIPDPRRLRFEQGIAWFPPPRSRFPGVQRLLPSQTLDLGSGQVSARRLMPSPAAFDPEQAIDEVGDALACALRRLPGDAGTPWLGLTAGYDSRLILALARAHRVDVRLFTRLAPRMSVADRFLPGELARRAGYRHHLLEPGRSDGGRSDGGRRELVRSHSGGHVGEDDVEPLLRGTRDAMGGISLGGHGCALASGFANWRQLPRALPEPAAGAAAIGGLLGEPPGSSAEAALAEWLAWVHRTPHAGLDWRDRMFLEQRQAGWLAAKEQLYDAGRLERFPILNAARTHALLLAVPEARRFHSGIQLELLRRLAPDLLEVPFNPPDRRFALRHPLHVGRRLALRTARRAGFRMRQALGPWRRHGAPQWA